REPSRRLPVLVLLLGLGGCQVIAEARHIEWVVRRDEPLKLRDLLVHEGTGDVDLADRRGAALAGPGETVAEDLDYCLEQCLFRQGEAVVPLLSGPGQLSGEDRVKVLLHVDSPDGER